MTLQEIAQALGKYTRTADGGYMAQCPAHEDGTPSLKLSQGNGKLLFYCHTGCSQNEVMSAMKVMGLLESRHKKKCQSLPPWKRPVLEEYDYCDANGKLKYKNVKFADGLEPRFLQKQPLDRGYAWNLKGVSRLPYNLPKIAKTNIGFCVVEGEKDVESLRKIGILATSIGGAGSRFKKSWAKWFADRAVTLIPDNDDPGMNHMQELGSALHGIAMSIKILELPGQHPKGFDISDWIGGGGTAGQLRRLAKDSPAFQVPEPTQSKKNDESGNPDYFITWLHTRGNGRPLMTLENLRLLLSRYSITVRYDVVKKSVQINIPGRTRLVVDNAQGDALTDVESLANQHQLPSQQVAPFLKNISSDHPFNPVQGWIESRPWNGHDHFSELFCTLGACDPASARNLLWRWMLSCIAAIYEPGGVTARGVLILQGAQHIGKTWWLKRLVNNNNEWFLESGQLDPRNKDLMKTCLSYWIVELGEIDATFKKAEISALKAFLSKDRDEMRLPFDRSNSIYERRTVFCGSVNPQIFLNDHTGTTRFWVVPVQNVDSYHDVDVQQVWAQVFEAYKQGEIWGLTKEEAVKLSGSNREFESTSPFDELVNLKFNIEYANRVEMTATEACIAIGYDKPSEAQVRETALSLRRLFGPPRKTDGMLVWDLPDLVNKGGW